LGTRKGIAAAGSYQVVIIEVIIKSLLYFMQIGQTSQGSEIRLVLGKEKSPLPPFKKGGFNKSAEAIQSPPFLKGNLVIRVGTAHRNSLDMKTLFMSPQSILWRKILVAQVFNLCLHRLEASATKTLP
jgi:hypothetical protein